MRFLPYNIQRSGRIKRVDSGRGFVNLTGLKTGGKNDEISISSFIPAPLPLRPEIQDI
jgi:hypothetical protein